MLLGDREEFERYRQDVSAEMATYKRRQGTDGSQMFVMFPGELVWLTKPVCGESSGGER